MKKIHYVGIIAFAVILIPILSYYLEDADNLKLQQNSNQDSLKVSMLEQPTDLDFSNINMNFDTTNTIIIFPIFTETAYSEGGFYDYFKGECDESCLTVSLPTHISPGYASSQNAFTMLTFVLGFEYITDIELDKNPNILANYDKVILLHNEYVTLKEFDSITSHPNVVYLYPNSLFAEIEVNYAENTITLHRGHYYPESGISNGFNWKFDNTHPFEFDTECENWEFYKVDNGHMLNCYPEKKIINDLKLIEALIDL